MDFYITTPSVYRFINNETGDTIGILADVLIDRRDYYFFGDKQRPYVEYNIDFLGMPSDLFPIPCRSVRLEIERDGRDQDNESHQKIIHIGTIDELHLNSVVREGEERTVHNLTIKCYTDEVREKEKIR